MKISYISGSTIPSGKANAVHVMKMCQALSRHKKASIMLYGKRGPLFKNPFEHYAVKSSFKLIRSYLGKIPILSGSLRILSVLIHAGLLKKPDVYYGRDALGLLLLSTFKTSIFFEAHQVPFGRVSTFVVSNLLKSTYLKGVVVISNGLANDFKEKFPAYEGAILVAHDGADIPSRAPAKIPQKNWDGRRNTLQVGYTGSLHTGRGMDLIVDIAHLIPEMDFHVIGGTKTDQKHWAKKGLPTNLFMHGSKPHSEIPSYLAKFDIVLAPYQQKIQIGTGADISRWISPMKLFEYMAAGKPIICSDLPALQEIISQGRNGLLVKADDPTEWVDCICNLAKSASYREALGQEGLKDIQDHYSWNIRADNILEFIKEYN